MIKLLKNKFLICMFLLVIGITVTGSCYASTTNTYYEFNYNIKGFDKSNVQNFLAENGYTSYVNGGYYFVSNSKTVSSNGDGSYSYSDISSSVIIVEESYRNNVAYIVDSSDSTNYLINFKDENKSLVEVNYIWLHYGTNGYEVKATDLGSGTYCLFGSNSILVSYSDYALLSRSGDIISLPTVTTKKIVYEITYDENNKKAQISASIKNAAEGDTLYYSTLGFKLNGKLLNPHEIAQNDISYIPVSENGLIHLQALDAER